MKLKTGQLLFFNWDNFYTKLIQFYNKVQYREYGWGHVGIIVKENNTEVTIAEAIGSGFIISDYSKQALEEAIEEGICMAMEPKIHLNNILHHAKKYEGTPYSWVDAVGIILSLFVLPLPLTGAKEMICSEAIARILYDSSDKDIDLQAEFQKPYDLITPQDLTLSKHLKKIN